MLEDPVALVIVTAVGRPMTRSGVSDRTVAALAPRAGVEASALSAYAIEPLPPRGGLLHGYAELTPTALRAAMCQRAGVLRGSV